MESKLISIMSQNAIDRELQIARTLPECDIPTDNKKPTSNWKSLNLLLIGGK